MVKDIQRIVNNLLNFYDFHNKIVVSVGAGGGQFIAYAKAARHVIAIDNDECALNKLKENVLKNGLLEKFTFIHSDFRDSKVGGDVVLFEFCLHEMKNPLEALKYGKKTAKDIVVADHGVNSKWAYIADEKDKAKNSWTHVFKNPVLKYITYSAEQYFEDYGDLYEKVHVQGENSIGRIEEYKNCTKIVIPMEYTFALL